MHAETAVLAAARMAGLTETAGVTDAHRAIQLRLDRAHATLEAALLPHCAELSERVNVGLRGTVTCLSTRAGIPLKRLVGLAVEVRIRNPKGRWRSWCGIVREVQEGPSDGGFATYQLILGDALALLDLDCTGRVFRDQSVLDITHTLLAEARARTPGLARAFAFDTALLDASRFPTRAFIQQVPGESRTAFLIRLWARHGINWVIRAGETGDDTPQHILTLFAQDTAALPACASGTLRYHGRQGVQPRDSVDLFIAVRKIVAGHLGRSSFDYLTGAFNAFDSPTQADQGEAGNAVACGLHDHHVDPPHLGDHRDDYRRLVDLRLQRHEYEAKHFIGEGDVRDAAAGTWFTLTGHPGIDLHPANARQFVLVEVTHHAENNLPKACMDMARHLLRASGWHLPQTGQAPGDDDNGRYRCRFRCVRRSIPIVPAFDPRTDLPRPPVMLARVVGPRDERVHCDRHGRIKVQLLGLRPEDHAHQGGAGTSGTDADSAWVRWATPWAGEDRGWLALPRAGDHVWLGFDSDDPDKPFVLGSAYDASNPVPDPSGRGALPGNRWLSVLKSREIGGSGYSQLRLDDSAGQISAQLGNSHGHAQLNLGWLTHPRRDGEGAPRGEGVELRTDHAAAVRAARGLLLTTQARIGAEGGQLDRDALLDLLASCREMVGTLADVARQQQAEPAEGAPQDTLKAQLEAWEAGSSTAPDDSGGGAPVLALHGEAGIAAATPASAVVHAGQTLDLVAGDDLQQVARKRWIAKAGELAGLFVLGIQQAVDAYRVVVARGNVRMQAQRGGIHFEASEDIHITAGKKLFLHAESVHIVEKGGASADWSGGDITLACPGTHTVKATLKDYQSGAFASAQMNQWPETAFQDTCVVRNRNTGKPLRNTRVQVLREDGGVQHLTTDGEGRLPKQQSEWLENATLRVRGTHAEQAPDKASEKASTTP